MKPFHFRWLPGLIILFALGCAPVPPATLETQATDPPAAELPALEFEIVDLPQARSLSLAGDGNGVLHLIYGQDHSLFVARSTDGGRTFSEPALGTGDTSAHILPVERPAIAVDGNNRVGIAWLEMPPDFRGATVWYAVSEDGGKTFKPGQQVAVEPEGEVAMMQAALDGEGNPILAWLNGRRLKFARSHDQGASFTETVTIGDLSCECCQPQILVRGDDVFIAYRGLEPGDQGDIRDIVMVHSEDGGATFKPFTRVSDAHWYLPACPIAGPSLAAHDGKFYIAWMDGRFEQGTFTRGDIWLASSQDQGVTFSPNIRINPDQDLHHTLPVVAIGPGGRIHITWEAQARDGTRRAFLFYTASDDGGQTFAPPQVIADNADAARGNPGKPALVVDSAGRVTLAWLDRAGARLAFWTDPN